MIKEVVVQIITVSGLSYDINLSIDVVGNRDVSRSDVIKVFKNSSCISVDDGWYVLTDKIERFKIYPRN